MAMHRKKTWLSCGKCFYTNNFNNESIIIYVPLSKMFGREAFYCIRAHLYDNGERVDIDTAEITQDNWFIPFEANIGFMSLVANLVRFKTEMLKPRLGVKGIERIYKDGLGYYVDDANSHETFFLITLYGMLLKEKNVNSVKVNTYRNSIRLITKDLGEPYGVVQEKFYKRVRIENLLYFKAYLKWKYTLWLLKRNFSFI